MPICQVTLIYISKSDLGEGTVSAFFPFEGTIRVFWVKAYLVFLFVFFCFVVFLPETNFLPETDPNTFETKNVLFIIIC